MVRIVLLVGIFLLGILIGSALKPAPKSANAPAGVADAPPATPLKPSSSSSEPETTSKESEATVEEENLRFVFYNLKNYLPMRRRVDGEMVDRAPKPESEIEVVVESLVSLHPEILGVCEIGGMAEVEDLRRRLKERGLEYPEVEWVDAADEDRHLALFSVYPLVERNSQVDLTYLLDGVEFPVQRGFLDVTAQVNEDYRLRCIGVHFKSKREVPEGDQALMRRNESHLLREYVDGIQQAQPGVNLLIYGDFNDTRNEAPIRSLQGRFGADDYLGSYYLKDRAGQSWTHHWSFANIYSRIDFVFFNQSLYPETDWNRSFIYSRKDWEEGSDHRPLAASIRPVDRETR